MIIIEIWAWFIPMKNRDKPRFPLYLYPEKRIKDAASIVNANKKEIIPFSYAQIIKNKYNCGL
jgi:hypothetical protein